MSYRGTWHRLNIVSPEIQACIQNNLKHDLKHKADLTANWSYSEIEPHWHCLILKLCNDALVLNLLEGVDTVQFYRLPPLTLSSKTVSYLVPRNKSPSALKSAVNRFKHNWPS